MTTVKIADLKAKLSSYLRRVRKGEQVIVTDRDTPVARLIPYRVPGERLTIQKAKRAPSILEHIAVPPARPGTRSLDALRQDREDDLER